MQLSVQNLLKQTSIYAIFVILRRSAKFVIIPLYTYYLTPRDFGTLEILNLLVWIIAIPGAGKVDAAFIRYYASAKTERLKSELFSSALTLTACLATAFCLVGAVVAKPILEFIFSSQDLPFLGFYLVLGTIWLELTMSIPLSYLRAINEAKLVGFLSLIQSLVEMGLSVLFVIFLRMGYLGILYGALLAGFFTILLCYKIVLKRLSFWFKFDHALEMLRYSIPMLPAPIFMYIITNADRYFLFRLTSLDEVGVYSIAYKIAMVLGLLIMVPFGEMWGPNQFHLYESGQKQAYQKLALLYVSTLFIGSLVISYFSYEVTLFLLQEKFHRLLEVVVPLSVGIAVWGVVPTLDFGCLIVPNKTWIRTITVGIAASANVCLNIVMIPQFGMLGAALAILLSFIILDLVTFLLNYRLIDFRVEISKVLPLGCTLALFSLLMYLAPYVPYSLFLLLRLTFFGLFILIILKVNNYGIEDLIRIVNNKSLFVKVGSIRDFKGLGNTFWKN